MCARHGVSTGHFKAELEALRDLVADALAVIDGSLIRVPDEARPLVRVVAATFDRYLDAGAGRHARAV